MTITQHIKRNN